MPFDMLRELKAEDMSVAELAKRAKRGHGEKGAPVSGRALRKRPGSDLGTSRRTGSRTAIRGVARLGQGREEMAREKGVREQRGVGWASWPVEDRRAIGLGRVGKSINWIWGWQS